MLPEESERGKLFGIESAGSSGISSCYDSWLCRFACRDHSRLNRAKVLGVDIDERKAEALNSAESFVGDISNEQIMHVIDSSTYG